MKHLFKLLTGGGVGVALLTLPAGPISGASGKEARVTQVVREVKLLPSNAAPRPAALNDRVQEGLAVRTGDRSRSELTFPDVTITRLGANTIFTFDRGGHNVNLDGGSVLLRVPKNSGGGNVRTNAVSVAITGTTLILEKTRNNKLYLLEGSGRAKLVKYPRQWRDVRAGQMLDVPPGATTMPNPQNFDINQLMKNHPLVTGFPPLPSRDLIAAAARNPPPSEPVYQAQPAGPPPGPNISIVPSIILPGLLGGSRGQRYPNPRGRNVNPRPGTQQPNRQPTNVQPTPTPYKTGR